MNIADPTIISYLVYCPDRSYECEIRKCDKTAVCSLYKQDMCMGVNRLARGCPELYKSITRAGQNSAKGRKLRAEFLEKSKKLPVACSLFNGHFWEVDGKCYFNPPYISLYRGVDTGRIRASDYYYNEKYETITSGLYLSMVHCTKEEFINDYWPAIKDAHPRTLFDYQKITSYQNEVVPRLKIDIVRTDLGLAARLDIKSAEIDYVGKFVMVTTLNPNITGWSYDRDKNKKYHIHWDGEYVTLLNPDSLFIFASNVGTFISGECKFIPSADLTIKIEDNSWVNDSTIIERC